MASDPVSFDTKHEEMIHDAQLDYYGKRLATASSDRTVKIFDAANGQLLAEPLKGHDGPVWQVSWAHPKYGSLLASCSYDGKVVVWKEQAPNQWIRVYSPVDNIAASVNAVAWAPHTFGLILAAASADGSVTIYEHDEATGWKNPPQTIAAHKGGCNAVSWGPDLKTGALLANANGDAPTGRRFVTAGCDNRIKIWRFDEEKKVWAEEPVWDGETHHEGWVRDVAWAPSLGLPRSTIASCSEDARVCIWTEQPPPSRLWKKSATLEFTHKVWRVSWSTMGNILAVSQGDNKVSLWKEGVDGEWQNLSELADPDAAVEQKQPES
mmetsp:Transcript_17272/g.19302  ORF Transcript_17272/g.19302 Transcript_17272/m.19302 type:complete len:323 (+) Transcript_17272:37-1005(+)|eukprot:CAMPEP_0205833234 /NCGR_PEP_ID=MMETSP0206-20130828/49153_1 /ASSEMBLY_ACC=CAM_ASM_000279 /TAXON_ID=36767 /ORGANISM="Euplotes focardii, Strain TN1" /LENGTH=322 /DNA_ID=CAMNT_0053139459 /DNA_START=32 /DNA_END=1000 /DNA_ORIENTATION=+